MRNWYEEKCFFDHDNDSSIPLLALELTSSWFSCNLLNRLQKIRSIIVKKQKVQNLSEVSLIFTKTI